MDKVLINEDAQQTIDDEIPENAQEEKEDTEIDSEGAESLNASYVGESVANPLNVSIGENKSGTISETNSEYFYRFTLSQSGRVTMSAKAQMNYITFKIYDAKGGELWSTTPHWNDTTKLLSSKENVDLTKGTYYFYASRSDIGYGWEDTGNFSFQLAYTNALESFAEEGGENNTIDTASSIALDKSYKGQIALNDIEDFYKFTMSSSGRIVLNSTVWMNYISFRIYDTNGNEQWSMRPHWNDTSRKSTVNETIDLTRGTYYFYASRTDVGYGWEDTGNYTFQLSRVKNKQSVSVKMPSTVVVGKSVTIQVSGAIGAVSYKTANTNVAVNKTGKVTGKNAGIAKITVTAAATGNYSAFSKTVSITVLPSGTSISSLKNSAKKKMLVKWKKNSSVSGYEIQYSTSSTFKTGNKATSVTKAATVSKTIGSLVKGKTYYVRIRTYKSVGNKKYYSAWSGKKKINIKK
ncbi:MAG: fibronectin type III domain-containing protein [Lachnospiraceae bacterium]|nr:fibronectin type III domain-containing protein [Lachnospiraceae bacterium]